MAKIVVVAKRSPIRDVDRTAEYSWLTAHAAEYRGQWVAVADDNLISSAGTLKELLVSLGFLGLERKALVYYVG